MSDKLKVAAVCGRQARVYAPVQPNGRRPLLAAYDFQSYGQALVWATEFDDRQKLEAQRNNRG